MEPASEKIVLCRLWDATIQVWSNHSWSCALPCSLFVYLDSTVAEGADSARNSLAGFVFSLFLFLLLFFLFFVFLQCSSYGIGRAFRENKIGLKRVLSKTEKS